MLGTARAGAPRSPAALPHTPPSAWPSPPGVCGSRHPRRRARPDRRRRGRRRPHPGRAATAARGRPAPARVPAPRPDPETGPLPLSLLPAQRPAARAAPAAAAPPPPSPAPCGPPPPPTPYAQRLYWSKKTDSWWRWCVCMRARACLWRVRPRRTGWTDTAAGRRCCPRGG
jgi:hypothetical protein